MSSPGNIVFKTRMFSRLVPITGNIKLEALMETKVTAEFVFTPAEEPDQYWVVSKSSGHSYRIDLKDFICSCDDFKFRHAKGDRMCKHLKAAAEAYEVQLPEGKRLPAVVEGQAITISQEQIIQELSTELRDEMIKNYVYVVPDYYRTTVDKAGRKRTTKKPGWIDLKATGIRDLAHMVADRYGPIEVGEFRFMDTGDKWVAWRDVRLGNFTATGFADCPKDREFPFRYLGEVVMRNAYKAVIPKIYQDIFTNKVKEMMRQQLLELVPDAEKRLGKPIAELTDGELAKALQDAAKLELAPTKKEEAEQAEKDVEGLWPEPQEATHEPKDKGQVAETPTASPPKPKRDPETIKNVNELLKACHDDWKMQPKQVYAELNVSGPMEITDPAEAYQKIAAVRG
jgi:hypothetical protein